MAKFQEKNAVILEGLLWIFVEIVHDTNLFPIKESSPIVNHVIPFWKIVGDIEILAYIKLAKKSYLCFYTS